MTYCLSFTVNDKSLEKPVLKGRTEKLSTHTRSRSCTWASYLAWNQNGFRGRKIIALNRNSSDAFTSEGESKVVHAACVSSQISCSGIYFDIF